MTFAKNLSRGIALGALAVGLTLTSVSAQNGTNYHVLTTDTDALYIGVGAGGSTTAADGIGTWVPGEDMRGSHIVAFSSDFGYRNPQFRENACVFDFAPGEGKIGFQGILFIEFDGMNANRPAVFTKPFCTPGVASAFFTSAGIAYGGGNPGYVSSYSFLFSLLPSGLPIPSTSVVLLPDEGLLAAGGTGTATILAAGAANLGIASTGFCWGVQFTWQPSALTFTDDIDGLWHYNLNSDGETAFGSGVVNQYWMLSTDELNLWQSFTLATTASNGAVFAFFPNVDYQMLLSTVSPNTHVSLAPQGLTQSGEYYTQTENVEFAVNPNGGFDIGRGSHAVSMSGTKGVPNINGLSSQDPGNGILGGFGPFAPSLGFVTWDNGGDLDGSRRLPWITLDVIGSFVGAPSDVYSDATVFGGTVRVPVANGADLGFGGLPNSLFGVFGHSTSLAPSGWPDAGGFAVGQFGVAPIAGASIQLPMPVLPAVCLAAPGATFILTFGTSGLVTPTGPLTWNENVADTSGSKEVVLFD
jgi:hypothetical protein